MTTKIYTMTELHTTRKDALAELCVKRGLKSTGTKTALVENILRYQINQSILDYWNKKRYGNNEEVKKLLKPTKLLSNKAFVPVSLIYDLSTIATWDIINKHQDTYWNWFAISKSPNITWDIIQANPHKPWDWRGISLNPNITENIVLDNLDKDWVWFSLVVRTILNKDTFKEYIKEQLDKFTEIYDEVCMIS